MWEEHPDYQKAQMRIIGLLLAGLLGFGVLFAVGERDWDLLEQILLITGALLMAIGLVLGFGWALIKILTRKS